MRKAKSLLGLSVITRADGKTLGTVRDLIFSDNSQKLLALLLSDRELFGMIDATCVPWMQVREVGTDAIMVEADESLLKVHSDAVIAEAYDARHSIDAKQITTDQGENLGHISDLYIDDSGYVSAFEVSGGLFADAVGGKRYLEMPAMMKVGTDVIIVPHDAVHQLELQAQTEPGGLKAVYSSAADKVTDTYGTVKDKATDTYSNIASSSVDKQRDFVIGKTAGRDVILPADQAATATPAALTTNAVESEQIVKLDAATATELQNATPASATDVNSKGEVVEGEVLVRQGETITEEHADRAISAGILGSLVAAAAQHAASTTYGNVHSSVTGAAGSHSEQASSSLENAALGKPSAREVIASDGSVLVAPGQIITQPIIDRADAHGKKGEVIAAAGLGAASVAAQDTYGTVKDVATNAWGTVKEKVAELTGTAQDKKADYDAASLEKQIKNAVGRPVTRVILAKDDTVILNTGDIITNRAVEHAREADVLDILLDSVYDQDPDITPEMLRVQGKGEDALPTQVEPSGGPITATVAPNPS